MAKKKADKKIGSLGATAATGVEIEAKVDPGPVKLKGTCDSCEYNRYYANTTDGPKGFCEVGQTLRGHNQLPPENTCDSWKKRKKEK